jgi:hypothetical protein
VQDDEVIKMANGQPHPQNTFYQQGRARIVMQLFEQLEQCSVRWKQYRDNEDLKEQARARSAAGVPRPTI